MKRRFAITGFGAVTPLGVGADLLHERAVACDSGLVNGIGRCTAFKSEDFLNAKQARRADRFCQLAIAAAEEALQQAGFSGDLPYAPERIACVIGSGLGGVASFETQLKVFDEQGDECVSSLLMPMMMANSVTAQVTMRYGFRGESYCVTSACSTGAQAIGAGLRMLANGEAETVIVGGAESATTAIVRAAFRNAGALSQTGNSVPFDRERDGFLIGEGAGIMVLENDDAAARRGAAVLGHILGYGSSSDAHHLTAPEPSAETAAVAVHAALG